METEMINISVPVPVEMINIPVPPLPAEKKRGRPVDEAKRAAKRAAKEAAKAEKAAEREAKAAAKMAEKAEKEAAKAVKAAVKAVNAAKESDLSDSDGPKKCGRPAKTKEAKEAKEANTLIPNSGEPTDQTETIRFLQEEVENLRAQLAAIKAIVC